jgi:hypothetical protein
LRPFAGPGFAGQVFEKAPFPKLKKKPFSKHKTRLLPDFTFKNGWV